MIPGDIQSVAQKKRAEVISPSPYLFIDYFYYLQATKPLKPPLESGYTDTYFAEGYIAAKI